MRILSRLDLAGARALARALPPGWTLQNVNAIAQLQREAQSGRYDVVVLDPLDRSLRDGCAYGDLASFGCLHRALCLPIVLFTPLTVDALDAVVAVAHHCRVSVIYRLASDRVEHVRAALETAASARLAIRVLHAVERAARSRLSPHAAQTVQHLFWEPVAFRRAGPALSTQGISHTALNAELRRAGLEPLSVLRRVARVAHAYQLVAEFDAGLKDVARRVGAGSIDSLVRETKLVTRLTPGQLRARLSADELTELAVSAALPPAG